MSLDLFEAVKKKIEEVYPFLKANKKREVVRLVYEILKSGIKPDFLFLPKYKNYEQLKRNLIAVRYPKSFKEYPLNRFYLPELNLKKEDSFIEKSDFLKIKKVVAEKSLKDSKIVSNIIKKYPDVKIDYIENFKSVKKSLEIAGYNKRSQRLYVIKEKFDFLKKCPCTKNCLSCDYFVLNLGFGCPMECEYCFLQGYQNFEGIVLQSNIEDYLKKTIDFFRNIKKPIRVGTGEFTDSLVYDDITEYSVDIIKEFSKHKNIIFEFKTKTLNIDNIFNLPPASNIAFSYSLNPDKIIKNSEHYTASFKERIYAIKKISDYGYSVGFHLDPIICAQGWKDLYRDMINEIFSLMSPSKIRWISLGTFRFKPDTKKVIENRFKENIILDEEMIIDFDGKLRYPYSLRKEAYLYILNLLKRKKMDINKVYLCMEESDMWKEVGLAPILKW